MKKNININWELFKYINTIILINNIILNINIIKKEYYIYLLNKIIDNNK